VTFDYGYLVGAIVGGGAAIYAAKASHDVKKEVKTNHGKRHGEYVEEIAAQVASTQTELHFMRIKQDADTRGVMAAVEDNALALRDHNQMDESRFSKLDARFDTLDIAVGKTTQTAETK